MYVVRNETNRTCKRCSRVHDYITRNCTPVEFSDEEAAAFRDYGGHHMPPDGMRTTPFQNTVEPDPRNADQFGYV